MRKKSSQNIMAALLILLNYQLIIWNANYAKQLTRKLGYGILCVNKTWQKERGFYE